MTHLVNLLLPLEVLSTFQRCHISKNDAVCSRLLVDATISEFKTKIHDLVMGYRRLKISDLACNCEHPDRTGK